MPPNPAESTITNMVSPRSRPGLASGASAHTPTRPSTPPPTTAREGTPCHHPAHRPAKTPSWVSDSTFSCKEKVNGPRISCDSLMKRGRSPTRAPRARHVLAMDHHREDPDRASGCAERGTLHIGQRTPGLGGSTRRRPFSGDEDDERLLEPPEPRLHAGSPRHSPQDRFMWMFHTLSRMQHPMKRDPPWTTVVRRRVS